MSLLSSLTQQLSSALNKQNTLENKLSAQTILGSTNLDLLLSQVETAQENTIFAQSALDEYLVTPTIPSASEQETINKYQNSSVIGGRGAGATEPSVSFSQNQSAPPPGQRVVPGVPFGAQKKEQLPTQENYKDIKGNSGGKDLRVKIRVPNSYLDSDLTKKLKPFGGILFPYTPTISYDAKAEYSSQAVMHSNYAIRFYQRSSISSIQVTGKFSIENESDAEFYLSTLHLLRALTKMKFGGPTGDPDSGAPPPVCRLDGHGQMMFEYVPVVISNVRVELPDSVDYFISNTTSISRVFGPYSLPSLSTISLTCEPMYSRNEMARASVQSYLNKDEFAGKGYL
jgi:hypothetical protein